MIIFYFVTILVHFRRAIKSPHVGKPFADEADENGSFNDVALAAQQYGVTPALHTQSYWVSNVRGKAHLRERAFNRATAMDFPKTMGSRLLAQVSSGTAHSRSFLFCCRVPSAPPGRSSR